jgi:hypothetical protein
MNLYVCRMAEISYIIFVAQNTNHGLGAVISQHNCFATPDEVIEHIRCLLPPNYEFDFEGHLRKIRALELMQSHHIDFEKELAHKIAGTPLKLT